MARWEAGQGISFSLARILASHIKALISGKYSTEDLSQQQRVVSDSIVPVVAIPDHLDEFGQELLLRELAAFKYPERMLIWRPVAAALSWLNRVEGDFPRRMGEDDHIHVIYLGPDAFEFSTFRLRVKEYNNLYHVLPLRDRPTVLPTLNGMDWAGRLLEENFDGIDETAFWQAFIQFPEVWQALAGRQWAEEALPRPWFRNQKWSLWDPAVEHRSKIYNVSFGPSETLQKILNLSFESASLERPQRDSMGESLRNQVDRMVQNHSRGRLRGMIVCGPLAPHTIPPWLSCASKLLSSRGLTIQENVNIPEAGCLWLSSGCDDPVADGAKIYGEKTLKGIPCYLDTMPQISILAQGGGSLSWIPLLKAEEVLGGEEHNDRIVKRFQLEAAKRNLHVFLYKGALNKAPLDFEDASPPQTLPGLSPCQARLVREIVRRLGSLDKVKRNNFFRLGTPEGSYGRAFAKSLFLPDVSDLAEASASASQKSTRTGLRSAEFDFPTAPERNIALDIHVRIRPASGLARIEILPEDVSFLQGNRVLLNYSTMRRDARLPKQMRGWPRTEELVVDPEDSVLISRLSVTRRFESIRPDAPNYLETLDQLRDVVLKGTVLKTIAGMPIYLGAIDHNGRACTEDGNNILNRIALKFAQDFNHLKASKLRKHAKLLNNVFTRAAWLFSSSPRVIVEYIRGILEAGHTSIGWKWAVEAGSRAFVDVTDFRLLCESIASSARRDAFPIQAARSVFRILMLREDGEKGLNTEMAHLFARRALKRALEEQQKENFKTLYFQMIRLLLYLLRHRITDPACFDPSRPETISVFEEAKESLRVAQKWFHKDSGRSAQISKIIDGFDKYLHYKGTEEVITVLRALSGDD